MATMSLVSCLLARPLPLHAHCHCTRGAAEHLASVPCTIHGTRSSTRRQRPVQKFLSCSLNTLRSCCVYGVVGRVWGRGGGGGWKTSSNFMRNTRRGRLQRPPKPFQSQVHFTFYVDFVVACFEGLANS